MRAIRGEGVVNVTGSVDELRLAAQGSRVAESVALLFKAAGVTDELAGASTTDDVTRSELGRAAGRIESETGQQVAVLSAGQAEILSTDLAVASRLMGVLATAHSAIGDSERSVAFRQRAAHFGDAHALIEHDLFPEGRS